jgi:hypothetical protein
MRPRLSLVESKSHLRLVVNNEQKEKKPDVGPIDRENVLLLLNRYLSQMDLDNLIRGCVNLGHARCGNDYWEFVKKNSGDFGFLLDDLNKDENLEKNWKQVNVLIALVYLKFLESNSGKESNPSWSSNLLSKMPIAIDDLLTYHVMKIRDRQLVTTEPQSDLILLKSRGIVDKVDEVMSS